MNANRIVWLSDTDPADAFPDVEDALTEPDGLLAAGGDLHPERLLAAYARGIFPWYEDGQPILWWSPDPRCVIRPAELHVARRLRQQGRNSTAEVRFNTAFAQVVEGCAGQRRYQDGTWITAEMKDAYNTLHQDGWAHSIEVWDNGKLSGGMYGLCIGGVFFGESMFSRTANASKLALLALSAHMQAAGLSLIDCQVVSPHLMTLGATLMPRSDFSALLKTSCEPPTRHGDWPREPLPVCRLFIA